MKPKTESFACEKCSKVFSSTRLLKNHGKKHKEEFSCSICSKIFLREHFYKKHSKTHETNYDLVTSPSSESISKCKFCPFTFSTRKEYVVHIENNHQGTSGNYFMCSDCGKQFKTKSELTQHINSKCGTLKQFICKVCGQKLMSAGSLYNHMLRHNGDKYFMCRFCAKQFFTAGQLKVHERIHTQDKPFVCEVCNKGFCHRQSLITHSTLHTGIKPYQCENCGNSFSCVGNLIKHRRTHADTCGLIPLTTHRVNNPSTKIKVKINTPESSKLKSREKQEELLRELTNLKSDLHDKQEDNSSSKRQIQLLEAEVIKVKIVSSCENVVEDLNNPCKNKDSKKLNNEIMEEATENTTKKQSKRKQKDELFESALTKFKNTGIENNCKYCGKKYSNIRWLYKHIKEHEDHIPSGTELSEAPLHKCSCCKMSFYTKKDCLRHQQSTHADLLNCPDCDKCFSNRDSLRSHHKVFHKGIVRKVYFYICEKCGKEFKQKSELKWHEERKCDQGPFFECSICRKCFQTKHTRNTHMRVHNAIKKFVCTFCNKSFHWKGQLKIHERSHTGEKPFTCLYCPKAFSYRESLITHSTLHTGIKPHLCEGCGSRFSCIGNLIKHRSSHANECGAWHYKSQS